MCLKYAVRMENNADSDLTGFEEQILLKTGIKVVLEI